MWSLEHIEAAKQLVELCKKHEITISTAESCTGGLISALITEISGSSNIFHQSFVTYANSAKENLISVPKQILVNHGAVSCETATNMSKGCLAAGEATYALAVTGIAGPEGGSIEKPVGLVYFGLSDRYQDHYDKEIFSGSRYEIRMNAVLHGIKWLTAKISSDCENS